VLAGSSSAGAMVAWWRAELGKDAQAIMDEALLRLPAVSRHVVLPYLRGRQCPARDLAAPAGLMTDALERDPVGETLAMFEGVAFQARWMLDAVSAVAGRQPNGVVVSGGAAAANSALMSMKASLSPAPMRRVLTPEPVATGAALIALERSGLLASVPAAPTEPIPNTLPADHYDEAYRRFVGTAVRHTTERHTA
jgi:xylulokinase